MIVKELRRILSDFSDDQSVYIFDADDEGVYDVVGSNVVRVVKSDDYVTENMEYVTEYSPTYYDHAEDGDLVLLIGNFEHGNGLRG